MKTTKHTGVGQDIATQSNPELHSKSKGFKSVSATPSKPVKVLNLYAGIGGNRKLWENVEVTAVENVPEIAAIYSDFFPNDTMVIADAHQYLLDHYKEFDFIWSSPPCPTHTQLMRTNVSRWGYAAYPDMRLYQEIIWLHHFGKCKFVVENVKAYYKPLIEPRYVGKHYIWSNFEIADFELKSRGHPRSGGSIRELVEIKGFDLSDYEIGNKRELLRNCVQPELGLHILNAAKGTHYHTKGIELVALDLGLL